MKELKHSDILPELTRALNHGGAFLSVKSGGEINTMTIGWATMGSAWGKNLFMAYVRPSRHTHPLLTASGAFSVSIPREGDLSDALRLCGSKSGRDTDKFRAAGLSAVPAEKIDGVIVGECALHVECRVVYSVDMNAERMDESVASAYKTGDYHTLFFGEIQTCYAKDA